MKKTFFPIVLVSALMTIISCGKSFDAKEEGLVTSSETKIFTATIENDDTKTTLDGTKVNWNQGDLITIVDGNSNVAIYKATSVDGTTATFEYESGGELTEQSNYVAYYPSTIYNGGTLTLPATQSHGTFALNPMYASSESTSFSFKNICSVLKITTTESLSNNISLYADKPLNGAFTVSDNNKAYITATEVSGGNNKITLTGCSGTGPFYIAIPAQEYKNLTIKVTANSETKTMFKKMPTTSLARNTIYSLTFTPSDVLPGKFSVADGKTVQFSCGNLHCTRTSSGSNDWTWHFYDEQYKYNSLSTSSSRTAENTDLEIDLFTWGYGTWSTGPITTGYLPGSSNLSGNTDWGHLMGSGWFTLSSVQWEYLLGLDTPSKDKAARLYKNGVTVCDKTNCLVIAPDGYTGTIKSLYDESTWPIAEAEGLVCLPAAGGRIFGSFVGNVGSYGYFWSSTPHETDAYILDFSSGNAPHMIAGPRNYGFSVRLVRESN